METVTNGTRSRMRVDGMTCPSCEHHVEHSLRQVGAHDVEADFRLPVEGMTCADCERHASEALRAAGAIDVDANFRGGEARFKAPAGIDPTRFAAALPDTPYRPGTPERVAAEGCAGAAEWPFGRR